KEIEAVTPGLLKEKGEPKFRQRFEQLHPRFLPALKERIPNIGRKEELLSMLIVLEQDNHQIAALMGIAHSSVNMARYRLRQKFGLDKEESLDDVIKSML
ncbi:MAG: tetratricopeptide repeat protein, partial [Tannerellaceae bacterium]